VADRDLRVGRPLDAVAREFGLDPRQASIALDDLVGVGVVGRDAGGLVLGGAEPAPTGALRLHDFLALADGTAVETAERSRTVVLLRPAAALLAAAALIAALLLAPGALRQSPTPVASNGGSVDATSPSAPSTPSTAGPTSGPTSRPDRSATVAPTTAVPPPPVCPPGSPVLIVLGTAPDLSGNLAVNGVARNTTDRALSIRSFTVLTAVGGRVISAPGTDAPLVVPPHSSVDWTATLPVATPGADIQTILGDWQWQGSDVPPGCPAP
jgi:hypothetical protein